MNMEPCLKILIIFSLGLGILLCSIGIYTEALAPGSGRTVLGFGTVALGFSGIIILLVANLAERPAKKEKYPDDD